LRTFSFYMYFIAIGIAQAATPNRMRVRLALGIVFKTKSTPFSAL
jgi:hypothetical protein